MSGAGDPRRSQARHRREAPSSRRRQHPADPGMPDAPVTADSGDGPGAEEPAETGPADVTGLSGEIESLREQNLRLQAEFDNYRKRQARDFHRLCSQGRRDLIVSLLDILDDLDLAREHSGNGTPASETVAGLLQIASKLEALLGREGLEAIPLAPLDPFDPTQHEAVFAEDVEGIEQDVVLEILRKGYTIDGEIVRAAMVKVGRAGRDAGVDAGGDAEQA